MTNFLKAETKQEPEVGYEIGFSDKTSLVIHEREHPDAEARFAMELLRHHGVLMGTPDGEDSAGRAKITYMPAAETAGRALDIAQAFYAEARARGLVLQLPTQEEIKTELADKRAEEEERKEEARLAAIDRRQKAKADA